MSSRISSSIGRTIRKKEYESIQRASADDVDGISVGSISTRITLDVDTVSQFITTLFTSGFALPLTVIIVLGILLSKAWQWNVVVLGTIAAASVFFLIMVRRILPNVRRVQYLDDRLNRTSLDYLGGLQTVRAYSGEDLHTGLFDRNNDAVASNNWRVMKNLAFSYPMISAMVVLLPLAVYAVSIAILPTMSSDAQIKLVSDMTAFVMYSMMLVSACSMTLVITGVQYPRYKVSKKRISELLALVPEGYPETSDNPVHGGKVEFRDVTFSYPGSSGDALNGFSMTAGGGEVIALIGPSGSGKTTVANLLLRLYSIRSGSITIDGMDLNEYSNSDLYGRISYAPQKPSIFTLSMRDNIRFGSAADEVTDEELDRIVDICRCREIADSLPDGLDTVLSSSGRELSGGQRQRISIARAVCRPGDIYILDDTFSALDPKTENAVREAIRERLNGRTIIMMTQRASVARCADRIYLMDSGNVVASGTHEELIRSCPYYSDIVRLQSDWEAME